MIEVKNLTKSYIFKGKRTYVFKDLSFKIERGQSVALLGKNGAGKSTLLRLIGGIDQPDRGSIVADCSVSWPVGLVGGFQGSLSARENVTFVSKIYSGADTDKFEEKVEMVDRLKVGDSVKVSFDLRGREYQDRYFVNLNAWKIEGTGDNNGENNSSDIPPPFNPADEILDEEPPF